jgi:hypothetical protein
MVIFSLPDRKSSSKPVRIPPPGIDRKVLPDTIAAGTTIDFRNSSEGPNCFSDVVNQKTGLPVLGIPTGQQSHIPASGDEPFGYVACNRFPGAVLPRRRPPGYRRKNSHLFFWALSRREVPFA